MASRIIIANHNFEAAYKKRKSGKLKWVSCFAQNEQDANKMMDTYVFQKHGGKYMRYAGSLPIKQNTITH